MAFVVRELDCSFSDSSVGKCQCLEMFRHVATGNLYQPKSALSLLIYC